MAKLACLYKDTDNLADTLENKNKNKTTAMITTDMNNNNNREELEPSEFGDGTLASLIGGDSSSRIGENMGIREDVQMVLNKKLLSIKDKYRKRHGGVDNVEEGDDDNDNDNDDEEEEEGEGEGSDSGSEDSDASAEGSYNPMDYLGYS